MSFSIRASFSLSYFSRLFLLRSNSLMAYLTVLPIESELEVVFLAKLSFNCRSGCGLEAVPKVGLGRVLLGLDSSWGYFCLIAG